MKKLNQEVELGGELHKAVQEMSKVRLDMETFSEAYFTGHELALQVVNIINEFYGGEVPEWHSAREIKELIEAVSIYEQIKLPRGYKAIKQYRNGVVKNINNYLKEMGKGNESKARDHLLSLGDSMVTYEDGIREEMKRITEKSKQSQRKVLRLEPSLAPNYEGVGANMFLDLPTQ